MSMELYLKRASEIELARYARDGFEPRDRDDPQAALAGMNVADLRRRLSQNMPALNDARAAQVWAANAGKIVQEMAASLRAAPPKPSPVAPPRKTQDSLNLHKSWHVLHYLFTGRAWDGPMPAATLLLGGKEIGEDMGYGRARAVPAKDTAAFAHYLSGQSADALIGRLDLPAMQRLDIYGAEDAEDGSRDELAEDIAHFFPALQAYVGDAARANAGLVIWMS